MLYVDWTSSYLSSGIGTVRSSCSSSDSPSRLTVTFSSTWSLSVLRQMNWGQTKKKKRQRAANVLR